MVFASFTLRSPRLGALVLGLFCASLGLARLHQATAHHGYCSEHGEQVHVDQHHGTAAAHAPDRPRLLAHHPVHGAHHCAAVTLLSQSALTEGRPPAAAVQPLLTVGRTAPAHPATPAIATLHLSPKTSPPAPLPV